MLTPDLWYTYWTQRYTYDDRVDWIEYQKNESEALHYAVQEGITLVPITRDLLAINPDLVGMLASWRHEAKDAYPADPATVNAETYTKWLDISYFPYPRIIYLIYPEGQLLAGHPIGHMGFRLDRESWPRCELDGILRGWPDGKGSMSRTYAMLSRMVRPSSWVVHPKPANTVAQAWYSKLGFEFVPGKWSHLYPNSCYEMEARLEKDEPIQGSGTAVWNALYAAVTGEG
ncbi:MAG: hypothetical protein WC683_08570 [bacterium]